MIWQLLKRDRLWWPGAATSIVFSLLAVIASVWMDLPPHLSSREVFRSELSIYLAFPVSIVILLGAGVYTARDLYEAALPLDGRDIWLSRLLVLLLVAWLPVPIGIAGGLPPLTLLAGASFTTALGLCEKCYRIGELEKPGRRARLIVPVIFGIPACILLFGYAHRSVHWPPMPTAGTVLIASGFVSLVLFGYGWRNVPRSFTIASHDFSASAPSDATEGPKQVLMPVFRSVYIFPSMLTLFAVVVLSMVGSFAIGLFAAIALQTILDRSRWLLALPISRRKLFGLVAAAPTFAVGIGSIGPALMGRGYGFATEAWLIDLAAKLACVYLALFLVGLPDWRPLSRMRTWIKWIPIGVAVLAMRLFTTRGVLPAIERAGRRQWWPMVLLLAAAAYWLAERAFMEQEYPRSVIRTNQARSLSI